MTNSLKHRGPDGEGYVLLAPYSKNKPISVIGRLSGSVRSVSYEYTVGLGHRRLAILDRSVLGHQPMSTQDGACWITYNGEIYNYLELRQELQSCGWCFRSMTDTEVILYAYLEWGKACLEKLNGMFAFAIWDAAENRLFCARDRMGMKPFYYQITDDSMVFGSEIKALLTMSSFKPSPNNNMVHDFLVLGLQDHTEETLFEGIRQLPPGHYLVAEEGRVTVRRWWSLDDTTHHVDVYDQDAINSFRSLFEDAVRVHLRSDVAVGSCLSGGLDSSSIVCMVHRLLETRSANEWMGIAGRRVKTFSSCFDDATCDERPYMRAVVSHAKTDSFELFPDGRSLFEDLPKVLWYQDEPFRSTSFLAQWAVMRGASERGVTVLLDGQGGDELLCGYPGYWGSYLADLAMKLDVRSFFRETNTYVKTQGKVHPTVWSNGMRGILPAGVVSKARRYLKGHDKWLNRDFAKQYAAVATYEQKFETALENHLAAYLQTHSLPALLHHEDRNAMAFSLEARLPFLDARLIDFLFRLPPRLKLRYGFTKYILRQAMEGILPEIIRLRTDKMGFMTPQDQWLRTTLRPHLEALFNTDNFVHRDYWDAEHIRQSYKVYCAGKQAIGDSVWRWACLELWHQRFFP